jgi:uncharacterized repeat protein (TIGR03803 family)
MDTNGVVKLVYAFPNGTDGNYPADGSLPVAALVQGTNSLLYGTTSYGGSTGDGTVFRVTTNGGLGGAWSLTSASNGSVPYGGLIQGRDGNFYGTTFHGGPYGNGLWSVTPYGYGTVFKLAANGSLTAIHSFDYEDGANPSSTLLQGGDGALYGTTQGGGTNGIWGTTSTITPAVIRPSRGNYGASPGWGTIFRITPAGSLTSLFSFANTNGSGPVAGLVQDMDGTFYGTTYSGGTHNAGTVFKLAADGTFTSLYSFTGGNDGNNCYGGLLLASDGNLYGTTESGGVYGLGTVFRITTGGTLATLVSFDGYQGANPECTLIQGTDGHLYGTTQNGGVNGWGAVFRLTLDFPLQITQQPQPQLAFAGDAATFSVATFGSLPVSYQWLKNGASLTDGGNLSGSRSRTLTLTNLGVADAAMYSVVVSNVYGAVTSAVARLEAEVSRSFIGKSLILSTICCFIA